MTDILLSITPVHFDTSSTSTMRLIQNDVELPSINEQTTTPSLYKTPSPTTTNSSYHSKSRYPAAAVANPVFSQSIQATGIMSRWGICFLIMLSSGWALAVAEVANKSGAAGLVWSTAKDASELLGAVEKDETSSTVLAEDADGLDGGFSSLDGMLQWAIGHSDPSKLKDAAENVKHLSPIDLQKRQMELKELMERLKTPSDAQMMQIAIDDLNNASSSLENQLRALEELLILVEPIDNANDFNKLGGFAVIMKKLNSPNLEVRITSAWIIGKACQNNPLVQKQVLDLGALPKLMMMVKADSSEEAVKALYAVSAMIRNNIKGQEHFYKESGGLMLQDLLSKLEIDIRLRRKAVFLLGDLVECHLETSKTSAQPLFSNQFFLKTVVDLLSSDDLDLQEKALVAIKNLLQLRSTDAMIFKDYCNLEKALGDLQKQLSRLMTEDVPGGYVTDVESLRRDVELVFQEKLQQDGLVAT
uniref:Nucleotide exchange factor Fes1 domain-containing protein n=1 Tax=Kalanchoe fedtschenkoi TaxID=63787 RepID=A0A7N0UW13_KALFE